jgi:hypothetical protein
VVGDVGEDRRAADGDAILHQQDERFAEKVVDLLGGLELGELRGEIPGEIDVQRLLNLGLQAGVTEAQATGCERAGASGIDRRGGCGDSSGSSSETLSL